MIGGIRGSEYEEVYRWLGISPWGTGALDKARSFEGQGLVGCRTGLEGASGSEPIKG